MQSNAILYLKNLKSLQAIECQSLTKQQHNFQAMPNIYYVQ